MSSHYQITLPLDQDKQMLIESTQSEAASTSVYTSRITDTHIITFGEWVIRCLNLDYVFRLQQVLVT